MSYDDFWFIDTRVQTRNLRRWLIWFILLFAFVTVGSIMAVKTMYKDIKGAACKLESILKIDSSKIFLLEIKDLKKYLEKTILF